MNADNNITNAINSITGERDMYNVHLCIPSSVFLYLRLAIKSICNNTHYLQANDCEVHMYKDIYEHLMDDYWISSSPLDGESDGHYTIVLK